MGMPLALAQDTTVLIGTVVDARTRQPLPDVVVTATSPGLQGAQVAVTDATGLYRLSQLPPGVYTLRFDKEGSQPYTRGHITPRLNGTTRFNAELLPDGFSPDIFVVATPSTVDVGATRTGVSVDKELVGRLPVMRPGAKGSAVRSFESLVGLAPGANTDAYGVSLNGATSPETGFLVDGLSTGNPALGLLGTPLSVEFIQEVNVLTGGLMPEFGRSTSGVVTAVTRSGSNEFHGAVFGNLAPGRFEGTPLSVAREGIVISTDHRPWYQGDFGAALGGPIVKDRVWFYAGVAPSFTRRLLERNFNTVVLSESGKPLEDTSGFTRTERIPHTTAHFFADQRSVQYLGKLTWQVRPGHRLTLSVHGLPSSSGGNGRFGYNPDTGAVEVDNLNGRYEALAHRYESDARDVSLALSSSFLDKRLLLDVNAGWHHQTDAILPVDGSGIGNASGYSGVPQFQMRRTSRVISDPQHRGETLTVPYYHRSLNAYEQLADPSVCDPADTDDARLCPVADYILGGPGFLMDRTADRYQVNIVSTLLLQAHGHHVIKAGADVEVMFHQDTRAYSGRVLYTEAVDGRTFTDLHAFGYLEGPDKAVLQPQVNTATRAHAVGAFVQDSWSILDRVFLNVGLRYDTQALYGTGGSLAFALPDQLSPRVGLVYDFTQQGRSRLFASYARYYQNAMPAMVGSQLSNTTRIRATRSSAPTATGGPGCDPLHQATPYAECGDSRNVLEPGGTSTDISRQYPQTFTHDIRVDPELEPQSSDELIVGGEYEVLPRVNLGLSYTRRSINDIIEAIQVNESTGYFIGNPGRGIASALPRPVRDYDALSLSFNKTFADQWFMQASYTWSSLRGNFPGLYRLDPHPRPPNAASDFDLISMLENRKGPLPMDRTHLFKVFGAREFVLSPSVSLNVGLSYRGGSGAPIDVVGSHSLHGPGNTFLLPRGGGGRLPGLHTLDAHVGFNHKLGQGQMASVTMDCFNVFNFQAVTAVDQNYTFDNMDVPEGYVVFHLWELSKLKNAAGNTPAKNPNFLNPTARQAPRGIRFGARLSF